MLDGRLKILQVVHYFLPKHVAGTEVLTYNLSKEFQRRGHEVAVFFSEPDCSRKDLSVQGGFYEDLQAFQIYNDYSHVKNFLGFYANEKINCHFSAFLDRFSPDVVHFHHLIGLSWGMIDECKKRNIPIFFSMHDFWLMCPQGQRYNFQSKICHRINYKKCTTCMKTAFLDKSSLKMKIFRYFFQKEKFIQIKDKNVFFFAYNSSKIREKVPENHIWVLSDLKNNSLVMHPDAKIVFKSIKFNKGDKIKFTLFIHPHVVKKITGIVQFSIYLGKENIFKKQIRVKKLRKNTTFEIIINEKKQRTVILQTKAISDCSYCNVGWKDLRLEKKLISEEEKSSTILLFSENYINWVAKLKQKKNIKWLKKRERLIRLKIPFFEKIIAPTPFLYEEFKKWGISNLFFSEDGIETNLFNDFLKKRSLNKEIRFAFIGSIVPSKGVHVLIKAFNGIKNQKIFLDIYGDKNVHPGYFKILFNLIKNPNINFVGTFEKNQIAEVYKKFDVLIVPSVWFENAPLVIRNAILAKTPIITSNLPGMNFLVKHGVNGFNFKVGDEADLQKQIEKFIKNPKMIREFANNMTKIKTTRENTKELEKYYYQALQKRKRQPQIPNYKILKKYNFKASIVIPTYNGEEFLNDVLAMINKQNCDFSYEVIAVDSGSTDRTLEILKKHRVKSYFINKKDFNHGLTRNFGISKAKGEIIVLLTQDAIPKDEDWLANIIKNYNDKNIVAVYVRQIPRSDCNLILAKRINDWIIGTDRRIVNKIDNFQKYELLSPLEKYKLTNFDNVCSSCRRSFWERNPYKKMGFAEDLRFGIDVILAGYSIVYTSRAQVVHSHNRTLFYEYKRTYLVHLKLLELYDFAVITNLKAIFLNVFYNFKKDSRFIWNYPTSLWNKIYHFYFLFFFNIFTSVAGFRAYNDFQNGKIKNYRI